MTKTIGVISIKGGVGKTTVTTNLGAVLANEFDKKVLKKAKIKHLIYFLKIKTGSF